MTAAFTPALDGAAAIFTLMGIGLTLLGAVLFPYPTDRLLAWLRERVPYEDVDDPSLSDWPFDQRDDGWPPAAA